jgi:nucleoside-diphosphate-sugar epimerase
MRVVITGASGNVGSALTRRLQAAGGYDIVAVARRIPDHAVMNGLHWRSIDLSDRDCGPLLRQVFRDADAVVHLAWGFQPSHQVSSSRPSVSAERNESWMRVASAGVEQVVQMSSVAGVLAET